MSFSSISSLENFPILKIENTNVNTRIAKAVLFIHLTVDSENASRIFFKYGTIRMLIAIAKYGIDGIRQNDLCFSDIIKGRDAEMPIRIKNKLALLLYN